MYELFKDYNAFTLVNLSHMKGSPWEEISQEYEDGDIPDDVKIDKKKTKDWFNTIWLNE